MAHPFFIDVLAGIFNGTVKQSRIHFSLQYTSIITITTTITITIIIIIIVMITAIFGTSIAVIDITIITE